MSGTGPKDSQFHPNQDGPVPPGERLDKGEVDSAAGYAAADEYEQGFYIPIDPKTAKKEKAAAREIKQSQWWRNQKSAGVCYWCKGSFEPGELTLDHKLPIAQGGRTTRKNVVPACQDCNFTKKNMSPGAWAAYLKEKEKKS